MYTVGTSPVSPFFPGRCCFSQTGGLLVLAWSQPLALMEHSEAGVTQKGRNRWDGLGKGTICPECLRLSPSWAEEGVREEGFSPISAAALLCDLEGGPALYEPQPSCWAIFQIGVCEA